MPFGRGTFAAITVAVVVGLTGCSSGARPAAPSPAPSQVQPSSPAPAGQPAAPASQAAQPPAAPQKMTKVSVLHPMKLEMASSPAYIADKQGFWAKRGIQVERSYFSGGGDQMRAVAAGAGSVGTTSPVTAFNAAARGSNIRLIATTVDAMVGWGLVVPADSPYQQVAELKGKRVAISSPGSLTHWSAIKILASAGLSDKDVTLVPAGKVENMRAGLKTKQYEAAIALPPEVDHMLDAQEVRYLKRVAEVVSVDYNGWFATTDFMQQNPDVTKNLLAGWYEAVAWMKTNKDAAADLIVKEMELEGPSAKKQVLDVIPHLSDNGAMDDQRLGIVAQSLVEMQLQKEVPSLGKLIDKRFVPVKP